MQNSPDVNESIRWKVKNKLLNLIYPNLLSTLPTLIFVAGALVYKLKGHISNLYLISWLGAFLTITVCQGLLGKHFQHSKDSLSATNRYAKFLVIDATLIGILWGAASILLMPKDLIAQSYMIVILLLVAAGGPLYLAGSTLAGSLYASCALIPLIATLITSFIANVPHHEVYFNLTLAIGCYWAFLLLVSYQGSKLYSEVVTLNIEKAALAEDLDHATASLEKKDFASMTDAEKLFVSQINNSENLVNTDYELDHAAHQDPLTGLDTLRIAEIKFIQSGAYARRHQQKLAVIRININNFNEGNLSKQASDLLLKTVAVRLQYCKRETDILSRLDNNAFVLVMSEVSIGNEIMTVVNKILKVFAEKTLLNDSKPQIDACLGISLYPNDGADLQSLIRNSEIALANMEDKNSRFEFYDSQTMQTSTSKTAAAVPPSSRY